MTFPGGTGSSTSLWLMILCAGNNKHTTWMVQQPVATSVPSQGSIWRLLPGSDHFRPGRVAAGYTTFQDPQEVMRGERRDKKDRGIQNTSGAGYYGY